ncbi:DUF397 domain-containing protein [Nonomuraea sp. 10N515B]|uniref:DUF397 domain-containing protein n=1 Tax=Nonomuraea sp. 10N515B TaxID=3457422 RepID=UPI003FCDC934
MRKHLSREGWRKSRYSNVDGNCVELNEADVPADAGLHKQGPLVVLRDSKDPDGPMLYFNKAEFRDFVRSAKDGEFDDMIAV